MKAFRFATAARATVFGAAFLMSNAAAQAAVILSVAGNSTTGNFTAWPIAPNAGDSTAGNTNIASFNSAEGSFGAGPPVGPPAGALGQSFVATQSGVLTHLEFIITGTAPATFNVNLFDAGVTTQLADTSVNAYDSGTPGGGGVAVPISANLLPASSQGLTWTGYTLVGATAAVLDVAIDSSDNVNLTAGRTYVFEVTNPGTGTFNWLRMANNAVNYTGGQAFRSRASLNGNPARDMSFASVVVVPEPATAGLLALGAVGFLARRRRTA